MPDQVQPPQEPTKPITSHPITSSGHEKAIHELQKIAAQIKSLEKFKLFLESQIKKKGEGKTKGKLTFIENEIKGTSDKIQTLRGQFQTKYGVLRQMNEDHPNYPETQSELLRVGGQAQELSEHLASIHGQRTVTDFQTKLQNVSPEVQKQLAPAHARMALAEIETLISLVNQSDKKDKKIQQQMDLLKGLKAKASSLSPKEINQLNTISSTITGGVHTLSPAERSVFWTKITALLGRLKEMNDEAIVQAKSQDPKTADTVIAFHKETGKVLHKSMAFAQVQEATHTLPKAVSAPPPKQTLEAATISAKKVGATSHAPASTAGEIAALIKQIEELIKKDPKDKAALEKQIAALKEIQNGLPNISTTQIVEIGKILGADGPLVTKYLSHSDQLNFWLNDINLLQDLQTANGGAIKEIQQQLAVASDQLEALKSVSTLLQKIEKLLEELKNGGHFKPGELSNLLNLLNLLKADYPALSPAQQKEANAMLGTLGNIRDTKGTSLLNALSQLRLYDILKQLHKEYPKDSVAELLKKAQAEIAKDAPSDAKVPFFGQMDMIMEGLFNTKGFPYSGSLGGGFLNDEGGKVVMNPNFEANLNKGFDVAKGAVDVVLSDIEKVNKEIVAAEAPLNKTLTELSNELGELEVVKQALSAVIYDGMKAYDDFSLSDKFQHIILQHFMPEQEKKLMAVAYLLEFFNLGVSIGNVLGGDSIGFGSASSNYDLSHLLNPVKGGEGIYSGSAKKINAQIQKELSAAKKNEKGLEKIIDDYGSQKAKIEQQVKDGKITQKIADGMIDKLHTIVENAKAALPRVKDVVKELTGVKAVASGDDHFVLHGAGGAPLGTTWLNKLTNSEQLVVNGDQDDKYPGSLNGIAVDINSFSQDYSTQSQTEQMDVQLLMTQIQQAWTLVSTALQLLNQSYMSLARGIAGH